MSNGKWMVQFNNEDLGLGEGVTVNAYGDDLNNALKYCLDETLTFEKLDNIVLSEEKDYTGKTYYSFEEVGGCILGLVVFDTYYPPENLDTDKTIVAETILNALETNTFEVWYEGGFVDYIGGIEGCADRNEIEQDIKNLFNL